MSRADVRPEGSKVLNDRNNSTRYLLKVFIRKILGTEMQCPERVFEQSLDRLLVGKLNTLRIEDML
jgi:hypothetical protein